MMTARFSTLAGMILMAAASRLIPHPPNFTPIAAMALFGGAHFSDKRMAFLVPLAALFLSDLVIGLHPFVPFVYASFALIVYGGFLLRRRKRVALTATACLASAVLFYVVTNFGVWALGSMYPKTPAGLAACYIAAIPFLGNFLAGNVLYTAILFGGFAYAEQRIPQLREEALPAPARS